MVREAARTFAEMTTGYDQLQLWVKLESQCFSLDSSNRRVPRLYGSPLKVPSYKGMYNGWGAFFGFGSLITLDKPIEFPTSQWSISFWMLIPTVDTGTVHTLVQGISGTRYVVVNSTGTRLAIFDRDKGKYRVGLKLDRLGVYEWHNVMVTYNKTKLRFYVDSVFKKKMQMVCEDPIKYIGNSADGSEPFGTFCDLRITDKVFSNKQIKQYSAYVPEFLDLQPDFLSYRMHEAIPDFFQSLHLNISPTSEAILRFFANIAANGKLPLSLGRGRLQLLNMNTITQILPFLSAKDVKLKREALRLLSNLE